MDKEELKKAVAIMQAYADGNEIEYIAPYSITLPPDLAAALLQYSQDNGISPNQGQLARY